MKKYNIEPYDDNFSREDYRKEEAYLRAQKKVKDITGFYWHAASYVIVNIFLIFLLAQS